MTLNRRTFNKNAMLFLMGSSLPPILQGCRINNIPTAPPRNLLPTVTETVNQAIAGLSPDTELLIPTFLGNDQRRFYGRGIPQGLNLLDKFPLGTGRTRVGTSWRTWSGAGWTGQPTLTRDGGKVYLTIGAYDHSLRKIDIETNEVIWRYQFDDVIKGSASLYIDEKASEENRIVILQGSRLGIQNSLNSAGPLPSFRAISFRTGQELWKLDIRKTASYSRDNDSSALDLGNGILFNAGENGIGYFLNSATDAATLKSGILQPEILGEVQFYEPQDSLRQGGNLVTESSPARLENRLFVAAGSGHIYGINIETKKIIWDFFTGSDIDGSVVISKDDKLFCAIERQYIPGQGGVFKLDPNQPEEKAVKWFFPTGNRNFSGWQGGIIGSVALNDEYNPNGEFPALFATSAIDGYLYIGSQTQITGQKVKGPWLKKDYEMPLILFKTNIGGSISTPIFTDGNKLIAAGYNGVYLFDLQWEESPGDRVNAVPNQRGEFYRLKVEQSGHFLPGVSFEATPIVWDGIVRICARDGWMYSLG
ncbi:PQQ-binding-like beta-propeller repeat protein [Phormidium pseudopriestleyi FRX01]|uniref:PQQ-binding-like beta-propeller repeat protein n=1 Tax=Phormidium pseudopriestleyi FRX01 TaxID=1759528 RepID=A0ABS3FNX7_9CYAN|nr:PQQ-binding-like beta-propeller repeat protein [Phormidium pseudopriestleyi]MBO0348824.1 PQQ-binding-like beta-propeller repeat protein [Phormidium pseudopriestleyi FRX01]